MIITTILTISIIFLTDEEAEAQNLLRVTQRVRHRPQHFYFSNKNRNLKKTKLPVTSGSPEVSD